MATAAARATRRAVVDHANRVATGTNLALGVATQIGQEWRLFCGLSFPRRLWWLLTGQIRPARGAWVRARLQAERERAEPAGDPPAA